MFCAMQLNLTYVFQQFEPKSLIFFIVITLHTYYLIYTEDTSNFVLFWLVVIENREGYEVENICAHS